MNPIPPIGLVVFDMAGTTVRDEDAVNICLREALAASGVAVTRDEVNGVMGIPKPVAIETLLRARSGVAPGVSMVQEIYQDFERRMLRFYESDARVQEMPGATEIFRKLRGAGVNVALDTGFARPIVDAIVRRLGWKMGVELDATVPSNEVARGRPHADLIHEAMRRTGVKHAAEVAKVGDTPSDIQEGLAAGCALVIGITHGSHTREQLAVCRATHLVDDLPAVWRLIASVNRISET